MSRKIQVTDDEIIQASKNANSGSHAASLLGIKYETYKIHAKRLGVFKTNQSGKGISKPITDDRKILLSEILEGKHPSYQSNKLRKRLFDEKIKEERCESCGLSDWLNKKISLEVDHKDGNRDNNNPSNLRTLCANCHREIHNEIFLVVPQGLEPRFSH